MKYLQIIAFFCVILSIPAAAQHRWGLSAGWTQTSLHNNNGSDASSSRRTGFNFNGVYDLQIKTTYGIRAEIGYSLAGTTYLDLHYLMMPLSFYYSPFPWIKVGAGPQAGLLLGTSTWANDFRSYDYGVQASVEFKVHKNFGVGIGNYFGLKSDKASELYDAIPGKDPLLVEDDVKMNRNNIFEINLCYYFTTRE